ncbi:hypothetical protein PMI13_02785 [Chryseobacterium populi]|uniref:Uncharacterized protein n=1 Tax=Chryseobacterium populi TaxID=1144316 RepID=J2JRK9_9FLAO|nr:hypothetical protein PMI13_02785 [Chryseobacterium populi]
MYPVNFPATFYILSRFSDKIFLTGILSFKLLFCSYRNALIVFGIFSRLLIYEKEEAKAIIRNSIFNEARDQEISLIIQDLIYWSLFYLYCFLNAFF